MIKTQRGCAKRKKTDRTNLKDAANLKARTGPHSTTVLADRSSYLMFYSIANFPEKNTQFSFLLATHLRAAERCCLFAFLVVRSFGFGVE